MFVFRLGVGFQLIQLSLHKLLCVLRGILYFDIKYHFALMYFFLPLENDKSYCIALQKESQCCTSVQSCPDSLSLSSLFLEDL